jgi:bifunctional non-homologous end joining protein LigD
MPVEIPKDVTSCSVKCGNKRVTLTNLQKVFFPALGKTKRDLLAYYSHMAPVIVPHLKNRATVMKRYPDGIEGEFFFAKRVPPYKPDWLQTCPIEHASGSIIHFPVIEDEASLLWIVNLGCIDLNPWYGRCDDVERPDYLHFDLDPVPPAGFPEAQKVALLIKSYLDKRRVCSCAKTTGSRGIHIFVPIYRGPLQKDVWNVAKRIAIELSRKYPGQITSEYRISRRPPGRVLVDYNQNAWGRTLASVYSVRPTPEATVSAPLSWREVKAGVPAAAFTIDTMLARLRKVGDLFAPLLKKKPRARLESLE